mgnify:CR=1 FL=1
MVSWNSTVKAISWTTFISVKYTNSKKCEKLSVSEKLSIDLSTYEYYYLIQWARNITVISKVDKKLSYYIQYK